MSAWRRDFALLWAGSAVAQLGRTGTATALPLLALGLTGSPSAAGWAAACGTLPHLLAHVPAGRLADRGDQRRIMLWSQSLRLVFAFLGAGALLLLGHPPVSGLLLLAALDGTAAAFYAVAEQTALPRVVPTRSLDAAVSRNELRLHLSLVLGRPLGGLLYGTGRAFPYVADALASATALLTLVFLRPFASPARRGAGPSGTLREAVMCVWSDPFQRRSVALCAATNALFPAVLLMLLVLAERQGTPPLQIGVLVAASGAGGAVGAAVAPRWADRLGAAVPAVCGWGWAALILLVTALHRPEAGMIAWAGVGLLGSLMNVALAAQRCRVTSPDLLGRVTGVSALATGATTPFGALAGGYAITFLGTRGVAAAVTIALVCLAAAVTPWRRPAARRPRAAVRVPAQV
ncbi:putative MFS family arabinose efflux permease [Actinocorallia herbida]|uniref:Putative MFS family arabinose efflux permease n=1 Tax=Actinocorallia herbida TaxID=58109 RepID=A0A3N1DAS4_9ACTN|nr:MFS transporter [Actinocorallia herbida]ROO90633.1 putative MFS family arabinose efflux permease [Actinocorallia herbida]